MLHKNTKDLTGQKFNRLMVLGLAGYFPHSPKSKKFEATWFAECECNKSILVPGHSLVSGNTKSCGCHKKAVSTPDMTNQRFGRLLVIREVDNSNFKARFAMWECLCDCGNIIITQGSALRSGHTTSCGCYKNDLSKERATKHGYSQDRLYQTWADMKTRCNNPNHKSFHHYGGRGISYFQEWNEFEPFRVYALSIGYDDSLTIERIDVNGNYAPGNIKFIPLNEQIRNRRNSIRLTYKGVTKTLGEWASICGINRGTAWTEYKQGFSFEQIFGHIKGIN